MLAIVEYDWTDKSPSTTGHLTAVHQILQLVDLHCTLKTFFIGLGAFILQEDNVARVVAAHLPIAVLDHTVLVVTAKQFQASLLYSLHLWGYLLRSVLILGKQVYKICYVLALPRCCPRSTQAAGGHHRSAARRLVLDANSTSLKQRRSVRPGAASRPSLPGQLFPHRPLQGAGAGETSRVQGTGW